MARYPAAGILHGMSNQELIRQFYTAFARLDAPAMNACYHPDIVFSDPVFGLLRGGEVRGMWTMLCASARDFSLQFEEPEAVDGEYFTCRWTATYTYSGSGRKVVNRVKAFMRIQDGLITEHSDAFRLSRWAAQALGWKGVWFGWMGWMQRRIQKGARQKLEKWMEKNTAG